MFGILCTALCICPSAWALYLEDGWADSLGCHIEPPLDGVGYQALLIGFVLPGHLAQQHRYGLDQWPACALRAPTSAR